MGNYFDKYDPQPEAAPLPPGANYFDKYDPPAIAETPKKTATASDRVQAAEGGILGGAAYLTTALPDAAANAWNLGKAGLALPWILQNKVPPHALQVSSGPSPLGAALTRQMDKSPITTTQPVNPDDTASRYLAAGGQAIPGALSGGGGVGTMVANTVRGAVPSMVGQAMADHPMTNDDTANTGLALTAQLLSGAAMPRGRTPLPQNGSKNRAVIEGQQAGFVFPPATTNPSKRTRLVETIAGKDATVQHAQLHNQPATNRAARIDMGLPEETGPIEPTDIATAKGLAAQGYDPVRSAGVLSMPPTFSADLQGAIKNNKAVSAVVPALGDKKLVTLVNQLSNNKNIDASTLLGINQYVRDLKSEAFRSGKSQLGSDYGRISKVLEDALQHGLQTKQGAGAADLLANYRKSRQTFARIDTVEEALHPSGNVNAQRLMNMYADAPQKMTGQLAVVARAAAQAKNAFKVPDHSAGVHHLGMWGSLGGAMGALMGGSHMLESAGVSPHLATGGAVVAAGAAAVPAARLGARSYALSRALGMGGQRINNLLPTKRDPYSLGQALANYPALAQGR